VPSHRADTPVDAPTVTATLPAPRTSARPAQVRRRDLRAHGHPTAPRTHTPAAPPSRRQVHGRTLVTRQEPLPLVALLPEPRPPKTLPPETPSPETPSPAADLPPWPLDVPKPAADEAAHPARPGKPRTTSTGRAPRRAAAAPARESRWNGISLPQAGIAGALGLATIAVPLTGAFAEAPEVKPVADKVSTAALAPLPPFPLATIPARTALDDVRLLPEEEPTASVPARLAAPHTLLVGRASRSNERAVLPGCDGHVPPTAGILNGQLPASALCTLWDSRRQLRSDAAVAIAKLNLAYQQHFGHTMCLTDAYRSLGAQYRIKAVRGSFAARPGTSEHGWGLAVDLCDGVEEGSSTLSYQWMRANAPRYGWENPDWALPGGPGPYEPWHWEYVPGENGQTSGD
jgi:zinc D-Ala-D-Ala carboxypeptidase